MNCFWNGWSGLWNDMSCAGMKLPQKNPLSGIIPDFGMIFLSLEMKFHVSGKRSYVLSLEWCPVFVWSLE